MSDETVYAGLGEFHDLFMGAQWERLRPLLRAAFGALPAEAIVAEIGAGTGLGTRVLLAESAAQVWALEPSLVMRAILTARIADDTAISPRVTIVAGSAPGALAQLPERLDGVVCAHMLGHLQRDERRALYQWLAAHLSENGVCLVTTQEHHTGNPGDGGDAELRQSRTIGQHEYRSVELSNVPKGSFSSRYEVWQGETLVRAHTHTGRWHAVSTSDLERELKGTGLAVDTLAAGVALVRHYAG